MMQRIDGMIKSLKKAKKLRYGENWDQEAYLLLKDEWFEQLHGKDLSFNNVLDIYEASSLLYEFDDNKKWLKKYGEKRDTAVAVLKHTSPCGFSLGESVGEAYQKAVESDPVSAFGGIVASNETIDETFLDTRKYLKENGKYPFIEVLVAPDFETNVLNNLRNETKNMRIVKIDLDLLEKSLKNNKQVVSISDVFLVQDCDYKLWSDELLGKRKIWEIPTKRKPTEKESVDGIIAWLLSKRVHSNSFAYVRDGQLLGICGGQPSRVDAARFARERAKNRGHNLDDTTSATDSFFPFPDGLEEAYYSGATANVNPGGGRNEEIVVERANDLDMALMFTRKRVFRHAL